jgi:hypothetical protein
MTVEEYDYDMTALGTAKIDGIETDIKGAIRAISAAVLESARTPKNVRPRSATLHLLQELGRVVPQVVDGSYTQKGAETLANRQPVFNGNGSAIALGATASADPDAEWLPVLREVLMKWHLADMGTLVRMLQTMANAMAHTGASEAEINARLNGIMLIARGITPVDSEGKPDLSSLSVPLVREIAGQKDQIKQLVKEVADLNDAKRKDRVEIDRQKDEITRLKDELGQAKADAEALRKENNAFKVKAPASGSAAPVDPDVAAAARAFENLRKQGLSQDAAGAYHLPVDHPVVQEHLTFVRATAQAEIQRLYKVLDSIVENSAPRTTAFGKETDDLVVTWKGLSDLARKEIQKSREEIAANPAANN